MTSPLGFGQRSLMQGHEIRGAAWGNGALGEQSLIQQTARGVGSQRYRLFVDGQGDLYGQFENNPCRLIASLSSSAPSIRVPVGSIFLWGGNSAPEGYLMCNGGSAGGYPILQGILAGGKLPNFNGRVVVGAGTPEYSENWPGSLSLGAVGGSTESRLTDRHLPEHSHTLDIPGIALEHAHTFNVAGHSHTIAAGAFAASHSHDMAHTHLLDFSTSDPTTNGVDFVDLTHTHANTATATATVDSANEDDTVGFTVSTTTGVPNTNTTSEDGAHQHRWDIDGLKLEGDDNLSITEGEGAHAHTIAFDGTPVTEVNGTHTHKVDVTAAGGHQHGILGGADDGDAADGSTTPYVTVDAASADHTHAIDEATSGAGSAHSHGAGSKTGDAGVHQHRWDVDNVEVAFDATTATEGADETHTHAIDHDDDVPQVTGLEAAHTHAFVGSSVNTGSAGAHQHRWDVDNLEVAFDSTTATEENGTHTHAVDVGNSASHAHAIGDASAPVYTETESAHTHAVGDATAQITVNSGGGHAHTVVFDGTATTGDGGGHFHTIDGGAAPEVDEDASDENTDGDATPPDPYVNVDTESADHTHAIDHDDAEPKETGSEGSHQHRWDIDELYIEGGVADASDGMHVHGGATDAVAAHDHSVGTFAGSSHTHGVGTFAAAAHDHSVGTFTAATHTHPIDNVGSTAMIQDDDQDTWSTSWMGDAEISYSYVNTQYDIHAHLYGGHDYTNVPFVTGDYSTPAGDALWVDGAALDEYLFLDHEHTHKVDGDTGDAAAASITGVSGGASATTISGTSGGASATSITGTSGGGGGHAHGIDTFLTTNGTVDASVRGAHTHVFTGTIAIDEDADAGDVDVVSAAADVDTDAGTPNNHLDVSGETGQLTRDPSAANGGDAAHTHTIDVVTAVESVGHTHTLTGDTSLVAGHDHAIDTESLSATTDVTDGTHSHAFNTTTAGGSTHKHTIAVTSEVGGIHAHTAEALATWGTGDTAGTSAHSHAIDADGLDVSIGLIDEDADEGMDVSPDGQLTKKPDADTGYADAAHYHAVTASGDVNADATGTSHKHTIDVVTGTESADHSHALDAVGLDAGIGLIEEDADAGMDVSPDGQLTKKPADADGDGADAAHYHAVTASGDVNADATGTSHKHTIDVVTGTESDDHTHAIDADGLDVSIGLKVEDAAAGMDVSPDGQLTKDPTTGDASHTHSIANESTHTHSIDVVTGTEDAGHTHVLTGDTSAVANHGHAATAAATWDGGGTSAHSHSIDTDGLALDIDATDGTHNHSLAGTVDVTLSVDAGGGHGAADASLTKDPPAGDAGHTHDLGSHTHSVSGSGSFDLSDEVLVDVTVTPTNVNNTEDLDHYHVVTNVPTEAADDGTTGLDQPTVTGNTTLDAGETATSTTIDSGGAISSITSLAGHSTPDPVETVQPYVALNYIIKHDYPQGQAGGVFA